MTDYLHRLLVTRPSDVPGEEDENGVWVPSPRLVLYDGKADVQDVGEALPRTATGQPVKESDASAFLQDEKAGLAIEPDDVAVVTYPDGRTAEGEVRFVRELDGVVLIRYR